MDVNEIVQIIANDGLSIGIVVWLIFKEFKDKDKLTAIISDNTKVIGEVLNALNIFRDTTNRIHERIDDTTKSISDLKQEIMSNKGEIIQNRTLLASIEKDLDK
ncbi:hypothetical protein FACS1894208_05040 [Clostridia bacterium]|nr:hypothetical protein FACS1894208_05040 [Clostridia bacterium]